MPVEPGQTLSHYRLVEKIGEGGMGVVWKAVDTTLDREVAIKILPEAFTEDPERLARFEREAKLLASLNHSNIAAIYGLEEADGVRFLTMELIPGQTLAEMIGIGPLPVDEALDLCRQIAEGLEAAHNSGVIHRDLKPGNVKVTPDGQAKVLDFGLAKGPVGTATGSDPDLSHSPTATTPLTRDGMIFGTAQYMSPEQARGKPVDKRTDIWSFGCLVYECLTGRQVFRGETVTDVLSAILRAEPEWTHLPERTPPRVRDLLERCLEKTPRNRLHDIGDARIELERTVAGREWTTSGVEVAATASPTARWRALLPWAFVTVLIALATVQGWRSRRAGGPIPASVTRFAVLLPEGERLTSFYRPGFAVSPDGRMIAFVSGALEDSFDPYSAPEVSRLYLRRFDEQDARPVRGTDGARWPVFSPDGRWIAFHTDRELKKVPVEGGQSVTLCETDKNGPLGLDWGPDGTIVFASVYGGLKRVSDSGGEPKALTHLDSEIHEVSHRLPNLLPGGEAVLYTSIRLKTYSYDLDRVGIFVESLRTGERKLLIEGGTDARYVSTGHLLFAREGRLMAAPFDVERLEITGTEVPVIEGISHALYLGGSLYDTRAAFLSVSPSGTLAYVPGSVAPPVPVEMLWVDRQGREEQVGVEAKPYLSGRVSADGQQVLLSTYYPPNAVWLFDLERKTLRRQTFEGQTAWAIWGPDADHLTFDSDREGPDGLYWKPVDAGPGGVERLASGSGEYQVPSSWSPDGKSLAVLVRNAETDKDIWIVPRNGEAEPFLRTRFDEEYPEFSPDGRWLVYTSDESGRDEVYVRPYPGPGRAMQISTAGGWAPGWARDGSEVFYHWKEEDFFAVPITIDGENLRPGTPVKLFDWSYYWAYPVRSWDVAPDGRFLVTGKTTDTDLDLIRDRFYPDRIHVVLNWFEELKRKAEAAQ